MPYVISHSYTNTRKSYWQTPWVAKRYAVANGVQIKDEWGYPVYARKADGTPEYVEVGGEVWSLEAATKYANRQEAENVNAIRGLAGEVESCPIGNY